MSTGFTLEIDLLRELLLFVEEKADRPIADIHHVELINWDEELITYHVMLAAEAGLLIARITQWPDACSPKSEHVSYSISRLTFNGHQFLESIRDARCWKFVKDSAQHVNNVTIGVLGSVAQSYAKAELSKQFGLNIP